MARLKRSLLLTAGALSFALSCASEFDDRRRLSEPVGTLGDDLYSALCDRLGAGVLTEDVRGASYHAVCHRDANGNYADTVDEALLPPVSGTQALARRLAVAKLHALSRRRTDLIKAFNFVFSDEPFEVPFGNGATVGGHRALMSMLQRFAPLYDTNPVDSSGSGKREGLLPSVTRATGRVFAGFAGPSQHAHSNFGDKATAQAAREALARMSGRVGYRPLRLALGAMRPSMTYPELRTLAQTFTPHLKPGGSMRRAFQNVLGMAQSELSASQTQAPLPPFELTNAKILQPNRPRTNTEIARALMFSTDAAFAAPGAQPQFVVMRGPRGYAVPAGNTPGAQGTVPSPFFDGDGDGFADVDESGRFLGAPGKLAAVDPPFDVPGQNRIHPPDPFGRAQDQGGGLLFRYVDASQTFLSAVVRDTEPLLNPDPALQSEAIFDLLSGAFTLYGKAVEVPAEWAEGGKYLSFDTQSSPMIDLVHASGWLLAHRDSDLHLKMIKKLFTEHQPLMARVVGAALRVREISNKYPDISLAPEVTFWDEMGEFLVELTKHPKAFRDILRAFNHPDVKAYIGRAYSNYSQFTDHLTYDTNNLNGDPVNQTAGGTKDPQTPVDRNLPDKGDNRSELSRILQNHSRRQRRNGLQQTGRQGQRPWRHTARLI